jgi:hypothetical protein
VCMCVCVCNCGRKGGGGGTSVSLESAATFCVGFWELVLGVLMAPFNPSRGGLCVRVWVMLRVCVGRLYG